MKTAVKNETVRNHNGAGVGTRVTVTRR
jgi:hypothetical protein